MFQLKKCFYSFKLSELSRVRSKHTLTLMKLWNANSAGKLTDACTQGTLEDWESWFIGSDENGKPKKLTAGIFKRDVLNRALKELGKLYPKTVFDLTTIKNGRSVVGYRLDIHPIRSSSETF
ncbi:replication initiation protein [Limosilactobacillus fermentum]